MKEGVRSLFKGMVASVFSVANAVVYFQCYEKLKAIPKQTDTLSVVNIFISSTISKSTPFSTYSHRLDFDVSHRRDEDSNVRLPRPRGPLFILNQAHLEIERNQRVLCGVEARSHTIDTIKCYFIYRLRKIKSLSMMILFKFMSLYSYQSMMGLEIGAQFWKRKRWGFGLRGSGLDLAVLDLWEYQLH